MLVYSAPRYHHTFIHSLLLSQGYLISFFPVFFIGLASLNLSHDHGSVLLVLHHDLGLPSRRRLAATDHRGPDSKAGSAAVLLQSLESLLGRGDI